MQSNIFKLLLAVVCVCLFISASSALAAADVTCTFKEIYMSKDKKWHARFVLKNNFSDKKVMGLTSYSWGYMLNGKKKTLTSNKEWMFKTPVAPGKTISLNMPIASGRPEDITDPRFYSFRYRYAAAGGATKSTPSKSATSKPAPRPPKAISYVSRPRPMTVNDSYILCGMLGIDPLPRGDEYTLRLEITNNRDDRELVAIKSAKFMFKDSSAEVSSVPVNHFVFEQPVKAGGKAGINVRVRMVNYTRKIQSYWWKDVVFEYRTSRNIKKKGDTTIIINTQ